MRSGINAGSNLMPYFFLLYSPATSNNTNNNNNNDDKYIFYWVSDNFRNMLIDLGQ